MTALYAPPDVDAAHDSWKANCGPAALAALLGVPVADVRRAFPSFPAKPWCSPTQMLEAIRLLGRRGVSTPGEPGRRQLSDGLAYVQFTGPWTAPGASPRWAYRHTHWIAVDSAPAPMGGKLVYDVNVDFWIWELGWVDRVINDLAKEIPRADGGWWIRTTIEVMP